MDRKMDQAQFRALIEEIKARYSNNSSPASEFPSLPSHKVAVNRNEDLPGQVSLSERRSVASVLSDQTLSMEEGDKDLQDQEIAQQLAEAELAEAQAREWRYWRERAMNFLIRREHSEVELRQKLQQRQCPKTLIDPIIEWLYAKQYLSLTRFAYSYSKNRADLGYGPIRVRYELAKLHHISERDIQAALSEINWHQARLIAERKVGRKEGAKYYAALYRRGFSGEMLEEDL